jgi:hypothetical protein
VSQKRQGAGQEDPAETRRLRRQGLKECGDQAARCLLKGTAVPVGYRHNWRVEYLPSVGEVVVETDKLLLCQLSAVRHAPAVTSPPRANL